MPANKYALLRYRIIDGCLTNRFKPYPTKEELRQACEDHLYGSQGEMISESTIEKDLWAMRNESELGFNAPIAYHPGHRGYYYTDPDFTIKDISLRDEEVSAIRIAAQVLFQFRSIEPFNQFEKAIEKIMNKVSVPQLANEQPDSSAIQFESAPTNVGAEHIGLLLEAIQRTLSIKLRYQKFTAEKASEYELHPLLLKEYRNRWYLIAFRPKTGKIQSFGLERIRKIEMLDVAFTPPADYDDEVYFSRSFGITSFDAKPMKVRFETSLVSTRFLQTQPLHHSQKELGAGERPQWTLFEIEVLLSEELIMYFLSLGENVRVRSPQSLVDQITTRLAKGLSLYGK